ncbi:hypothetical protein AZE42_08017 [Rhizopogon vesiculosus]|uniref:Smr domain-containing protein n=1 Tax=Rhizopogon vesiculosus TaxID=180088 RepID=A0A1J8PJP2_9AGAM|nr:hypothetical protein AZE42_08017 [Rhizopogon vesiculosus]
MVRLNKEASAKIFQENNKRSTQNTVDLHGLYVAEAEFYFERTVEQADREQSLRVIVGRGNHSDGNTPKIKPAIQALGESWRRSGPPPPQRPPSPYSPHPSRDSRSQLRSYRQVPTSRIEGVKTTSQYHDHETPLRSYPPRRQPSALCSIETPLSYVVVNEPVSPQVRPSVLHLMFTHLFNA